MDTKKIGVVLLTLALLSPLAMAAITTQNIVGAMSSLVDFVTSLFASLTVVLVALAAIAYAAGNMLGAETGARAKVWAQNLLIGAIISAIIWLVAKPIIKSLF